QSAAEEQSPAVLRLPSMRLGGRGPGVVRLQHPIAQSSAMLQTDPRAGRDELLPWLEYDQPPFPRGARVAAEAAGLGVPGAEPPRAGVSAWAEGKRGDGCRGAGRQRHGRGAD